MALYFSLQRIQNFYQYQAIKESYEQKTGDNMFIQKNSQYFPILTQASDSSKQHKIKKQAQICKKTTPFTDPVFQSMSLQEHTNYIELFEQKHQTSTKFLKLQNNNVQNNQKDTLKGQKYKIYLLNIQQSLSLKKSNNILQYWQLQRNINELTLILQNISYLTPQDKQIILQTSRKYQKVGKFIFLLFNGLMKQFLNPIIKLSICAFKQWNVLKSQKLTQKELIIAAKKLVKDKILPVCWKYFKGCKKSLVQEFCNFYMVTNLFLLADYFVNPYYQIQYKLVVPQFALYENLLYNNLVRPKNENESSQKIRKIFKYDQQ